jgi:hypothetical protein
MMDIHRYIVESPTENREYYFTSDPGIDAVKQRIQLDVQAPIYIFDVFPIYSRKQILAVLGKKETISTLSYDLTIIDDSGNEVEVPEGTAINFIEHGLVLYTKGGEDNAEECQVSSREYEMV